MTGCGCRKGAVDPCCDRPEHSSSTDLSVSSPAFYEERIRLLETERDAAIKERDVALHYRERWHREAELQRERANSLLAQLQRAEAE